MLDGSRTFSGEAIRNATVIVALHGGAQRGDGDAWVAKYSTRGRVLWKRQLGTEVYDVWRDNLDEAAATIRMAI
jgi:hypothetical protein